MRDSRGPSDPFTGFSPSYLRQDKKVFRDGAWGPRGWGTKTYGFASNDSATVLAIVKELAPDLRVADCVIQSDELDCFGPLKVLPPLPVLGADLGIVRPQDRRKNRKSARSEYPPSPTSGTRLRGWRHPRISAPAERSGRARWRASPGSSPKADDASGYGRRHARLSGSARRCRARISEPSWAPPTPLPTSSTHFPSAPRHIRLQRVRAKRKN
jgi:hypothetical protein